MKEIDKKNEKANTAWRQYRTVYCYSNHHSSKRNSNSSNTNITGISFECYCYKSIEHYITDCEFQTASKDYIKNLHLKKEKGDANAKPSRTTERTKEKKFHSAGRKRPIKPFKGKKHNHAAANQSSDDSKYYTGTESPSEDDNEEEPESDKTEKVMLTKEEISKSTPADWVLDTGASSPMTDQFDLYRKRFLRSSHNVPIQVRKGMLYSRKRETALVRADDDTSC